MVSPAALIDSAALSLSFPFLCRMLSQTRDRPGTQDPGPRPGIPTELSAPEAIAPSDEQDGNAIGCDRVCRVRVKCMCKCNVSAQFGIGIRYACDKQSKQSKTENTTGPMQSISISRGELPDLSLLGDVLGAAIDAGAPQGLAQQGDLVEAAGAGVAGVVENSGQVGPGVGLGGHERAGHVRGVLPLLDLELHGLELLLEALAEDVDVVGGAVVDGPAEDDHQVGRRGIAVPEPDRAGQHGQHRVDVLDEHERGFLQVLRQREHELADPHLGVRLPQPGERGRAARGDLLAPPHRDEEVVRELPEGVRDGRPQRHGEDGVVLLRAERRRLDGVDGGEALALVLVRQEVHQAVEGRAGHDVDEEARDLVEAVEDHRVPPHGDGHRVVPEREAERADEQPLGLWKHPDGQHAEEVDEVAQVRQEVVVPAPVVRVEADWHEVGQLGPVPQVEQLGIPSDYVATDEHVQHPADERHLLPQRDDPGVVPALSQPVHALAHLLPVPVELLVRGRYPAPPLLDDPRLGSVPTRPEGISLPADLLRLCRDVPLQLLQLLWQRKVVQQVEHRQPLQRREGLPILLI